MLASPLFDRISKFNYDAWASFAYVTHGTVQRLMRHEKEIPSLVHGNTSVDNCSWLDVAATLLIGSIFARRIESVVVILADNDEGDLWLGRGLKNFLTSSFDRGYLFAQHNCVLAFRYA